MFSVQWILAVVASQGKQKYGLYHRQVDAIDKFLFTYCLHGIKFNGHYWQLGGCYWEMAAT